jgi:hypothetical protein
MSETEVLAARGRLTRYLETERRLERLDPGTAGSCEMLVEERVPTAFWDRLVDQFLTAASPPSAELNLDRIPLRRFIREPHPTIAELEHRERHVVLTEGSRACAVLVHPEELRSLLEARERVEMYDHARNFIWGKEPRGVSSRASAERPHRSLRAPPVARHP